MILTNQEAAAIARRYVLDAVDTIGDDYGDIAEAIQEAHPSAVDEDYELASEYVTDWRNRLQSYIKEVGAV